MSLQSLPLEIGQRIATLVDTPIAPWPAEALDRLGGHFFAPQLSDCILNLSLVCKSVRMATLHVLFSNLCIFGKEGALRAQDRLAYLQESGHGQWIRNVAFYGTVIEDASEEFIEVLIQYGAQLRSLNVWMSSFERPELDFCRTMPFLQRLSVQCLPWTRTGIERFRDIDPEALSQMVSR